MRKIKGIVSVCSGLALACMLLVVGIFAAANASVQVSVSVNYTPSVSATLKAVTSDSESGCYWDGASGFPATEAASGTNGYIKIADNTRIPATSNEFLNCDSFGRLTVYLQVENTSGFDVCTEISVVIANGETSPAHIQSVENVYLAAKTGTAGQTNNIGIAKVVLKSLSTTTGADATLNVDVVRCDGKDGSANFNPALLYTVGYSIDNNDFKTIISKTATGTIMPSYNLATVIITNENPNIFTITSTSGTFYLKITNNVSGAAIYYKAGSGASTSVAASAVSNSITISSSSTTLTLSNVAIS